MAIPPSTAYRDSCPRPTRYGQLLLVMVTTFECLGCGLESILEKLPAKCPNCGHGNGLLREMPEPVPAVPPKSSRENPPLQ